MSDSVDAGSLFLVPKREAEDRKERAEEVALATGWVYDENAQVRTLSHEEYLQLFKTGSK